jgi:Flp pilus assembly protein TadD
MKLRLVGVAAAALALAGCRAKEISPHDRELAANDLSEAQFALTLKDWPRAEGLFAHAAGLCPDDGTIWENLGVVRMREQNPRGARDAYKSALAAFKDAYKRRPEDSSPLLGAASVLVILGRADDARSLVNDAAARHPEDRRLRAFVEAGGVDKLVARPGLKEISP